MEGGAEGLNPDPLHAMQFRATPPPQVRDQRPAHWSSPSDRGCPVDTAGVRCLWHADGTAGENDDAPTWRDGSQLDRRVRPVLGDHLPRWQASARTERGIRRATAGGLRRGSRLLGPTASWDAKQAGRVSLEPRLTCQPIPSRPQPPRPGSSRCGGSRGPTDPADGSSARDPSSPVAETSYSTCGAWKTPSGSERRLLPGLAAFALWPGQAMQPSAPAQ